MKAAFVGFLVLLTSALGGLITVRLGAPTNWRTSISSTAPVDSFDGLTEIDKQADAARKAFLAHLEQRNGKHVRYLVEVTIKETIALDGPLSQDKLTSSGVTSQHPDFDRFHLVRLPTPAATARPIGKCGCVLGNANDGCNCEKCGYWCECHKDEAPPTPAKSLTFSVVGNHYCVFMSGLGFKVTNLPQCKSVDVPLDPDSARQLAEQLFVQADRADGIEDEAREPQSRLVNKVSE